VLFEPRTVISEVLELLAPRAADKRLELRCEAHAELPRILVGDPGRLRQILLNLIGNALKFTDEGEVTVKASLAGSSAEMVTMRFLVRDTGIGISPENCSRLFESFVQGDSSTTRKYGGTGLGLAISKQLVEMMNGRIEVESELGRGSAFSFQVIMERFQPQIGAGPFALAGCRALVMDGNAETGAVTRDYLDELGCRATHASPATALGRIHEAAHAGDPFRIILCDLTLPEPEFSALHHAIASDPATAGSVRIGCTEIAIRGDRRIRALGFAGILQQPIDPAMLHDTLLAAIEKRAAVR